MNYSGIRVKAGRPGRETRQEATAKDSDSGDDGLFNNMDIEPT